MTDSKADLIAPVVSWVEAVDAAGILKAPEEFLVAYGAVHRSIARLLETGKPDHAPSLLTALAACEFIMAESPDFIDEFGLPPIQPLPADWLALIDDGSAEFRLAASLSALRPVGLDGDDHRIRPFRAYLEPVAYHFDPSKDGLEATSLRWDFKARKEVIWDKERAVGGLNAIFARRLKMWDAADAEFDQSAINAHLSDIALFLRDETDEAKFSRLCFELALVDAWRLSEDPLVSENRLVSENPLTSEDLSAAAPIDADVDQAFALAKLCYCGPDTSLNRDIHLLANRGDLDTAIEFGGAHLRKHGIDARRDRIDSDLDARRVAAALLFPIGDDQRDVLAQAVQAI